MKKLFRKVKESLSFKDDLPPPYEENAERAPTAVEGNTCQIVEPYQVLDLLAACTLSLTDQASESASQSHSLAAPATESETMGLKHSTPWSSRHRSKISLTWVLREQSDATNSDPQRTICYDEYKVKNNQIIIDGRLNPNIDENLNKRNRSREPSQVSTRMVGRSEMLNDVKCSVKRVQSETCSNSESDRNLSKRHRHRRRRRREDDQFGYEIKNIDGFLAEASIDHPGNIPVVLSCSSVLYQTNNGAQKEMALPLGTVVNAVFKNQQWLYVQTPHAEEGYIKYSACLPLGIIPNVNKSKPPWRKTPCWESSTDIYPRPRGNMTDTEKKNLRGRTRSECGYRLKHNHDKLKPAKSVCGEEVFDKLYLRTTSVCSQKNLVDVESDSGDMELDTNHNKRKSRSTTQPEHRVVTRHTLLVISQDYTGGSYTNTVSVRQGDVVMLVQGGGAEADVDSEWFYVRKRNGEEGFIPADIAGHGYI